MEVSSVSAGDLESEMQSSNGKERGSWITFPFIIGAMMGLSVTTGGWLANLIVYLIEEFNIKPVDATQIFNVVSGGLSLIPIAGAIIADSFVGNYIVIAICSCLSLLGVLLLVLTAVIDSLRPKPCELGSPLCKTPSEFQYAVLYGGLLLACIGCGVTRFTLATMGADQFNRTEDKGIFFNWFFISLYASYVFSFTAIVYIEDNVSWGVGFGVCLAANFIGLLIFMLGSRFYRYVKPHQSPFIALARVIVASIRKRKLQLSSRIDDYYFLNDPKSNEFSILITKNLRFFNRAAIKTEGDVKLDDGSIVKPWRLCTVEQVEDFKAIMRVILVWSSGIILYTIITVQAVSTVLQALTMNRHMGPHFKIPVGSINVMVLLSSIISISLIDRFLYPLCRKLLHKSFSPLLRIGIGHVINVISMIVSVIVEKRRLRIAHSQEHDGKASIFVPMLAVWLFPQLILAGIGEAFHFPGQVTLYYQEFPSSLRSVATSLGSLVMGIGFYLSTSFTHLVRRYSDWLPSDINHGRMDNVYWVLTILGTLNFGYFLCCAKFYKYQHM